LIRHQRPQGIRRVVHGTDQQAAERPQWLSTGSSDNNDTNTTRPRTRAEMIAERRAADRSVAAAHLIASALPDARRMQSELAATFNHNPPLPIAEAHKPPPAPIVRVFLGNEEEEQWMEQLPDGTQRHVIAESPPSMRVNKKRQVNLTKITATDVKSHPIKARHTKFTSVKYHDRSVPATAKDDIPVGGDRWWHEYARVRQQNCEDQKMAEKPFFSSFAPDGLFHEPYYMTPPQPVARSLPPRKIPSMTMEWRPSDMIEYQAQMAAGVPLSLTHLNGTTTTNGNDRAPSALDGLLPAAAWPNSASPSVPQSPLPLSTSNGKEFNSKKDSGINGGKDQNEEKTNDSPQSPPIDRDLSAVLSTSPPQAPLTPSMSASPSMSSLRPRARPSGVTRAVSITETIGAPLLSKREPSLDGTTTRGDGTLSSSSTSVRSGLNRQSSTPSLSSTSKWDQQRSHSAMAHDDYLSSFATSNGESSPMTTKSLHNMTSDRHDAARAVTAGSVRRSYASSSSSSTTASPSSTSWAARSSSPIAPFIPVRSIAAKQSSIMAKSMRHSFSTGTVGLVGNHHY